MKNGGNTNTMELGGKSRGLNAVAVMLLAFQYMSNSRRTVSCVTLLLPDLHCVSMHSPLHQLSRGLWSVATSNGMHSHHSNMVC